MAELATTLDEVTATYSASWELMQRLFQQLTNPAATPAELQAALSYMACQPLLSVKGARNSHAWLDEICEVEVSDWLI